MYEMLIEFFIVRPGRLSALGRALVQLSAAILLIGLGGHVVTTATSAIYTTTAAVQPGTSLAMLYPSLPTWWVPESLPGYVAWALTGILGLAMVQLGKVIDRLIR